MNNKQENEEEKEIDKDIHTETTHTQQREKGVSKERPREQRNEICSISNPLPLIHPHQPFQIKLPDLFII